jgi:hypothetical protein
VQRERAALIRKLGACIDCRRRRVAVSDYDLSSLFLFPFCSCQLVLLTKWYSAILTITT